ncbi:MAG: stage II sporulation protein M [Planctomycetota bacterium]|nr:MAG: stage II sporulation protein M [Planctomycetota bacterium]REJ89925.1 MAG: stage II sporulation protein M [Planctomycetota bacterium]REK21544.1 MAG: stage II sporulation protein M [Planctomycetota bacterium]REK39901.1 MAG: stage II sporulation protein M [Planctomycetota bacterium]
MSSFVSRNKQDWDELERLVRRGRRSLRDFSAEDLSRLDVLYRRTTIHLARASTRTTDRRLIDYLNGLTAAAHSLIYLPPRRSILAGTVQFFVEGFARCIARNLRLHALALVLFIAGGFLAYHLAVTDTMAAYALSMPGDPRQPGATREQLEEFLRYGRDEGGGEKFFFATFLFQHNFKVGLLSMASGVLAGVPTVLLLVYNGMILGAFVAIHHQAGITWEVWAWLLPHGVTEIGAIILCGGVGLMLGRSVLRPGEMSRADSLRLAGYEAAKTAVGIGLMLVAAAVIESYLRQSHLSTSARFLFAGGTALFWAVYIGWGVLRERTAEKTEANA